MQSAAINRSQGFLTETLVIALAYWALARLGQFVAIEPGNVTPVWPASGLALVVVLWRGYRVWPALWLGNFLGNVHAFVDMGTLADAVRTLVTGIAIGPGDVLQACLGAYLIRRVCKKPEPFDQIRDVFCFVGTQIVACLSSATFGALSLCLGSVLDWSDYSRTWLTWFLGDGLGVILVAPLLLTFRQSFSLIANPKRLLEVLIILSLATATSMLIFSGTIPAVFLYVTLVLVLWSAVREGSFAVSASVFVITMAAIWFMSIGRAPHILPSANASLLSLQIFAAITSVTGLTVAAALSAITRHDERVADE